MANHGFVSTKQKLTKEKLKAALDDINQRRFGGKLKITGGDDPGWNGNGTTFEVEFYSDKEGKHTYSVHRLFWLASAHKIEHRHGPGSDFAWWIESTIANELALVFNGTISDEGVSEKWKGRRGWCPTFRSYQDMHVEHGRNAAHRVMLRVLKLMQIKEARRVRPDLKDVIG